MAFEQFAVALQQAIAGEHEIKVAERPAERGGLARSTGTSERRGGEPGDAADTVDVSDYGMYDTSTIRKSVGATVSVTFSGR